jgi:polyisoprenoid-binding protein YceI
MISVSLSRTIIVALALSTSWAQDQSAAVYKVDATRSRIEITVLKAGLFKAIGHDHKIEAKSFSGDVRFNSSNIGDSSVTLKIESGSLVVLDDPNLSEKDRKEVQANMLGVKILNAAEFPLITFRSTRVSDIAHTGEDFTLTGTLDLHGVGKEITFPMHVHREDNLLRTTGMLTISQTGFGIKPFKGAAGTLRLKDEIKMNFYIAAERVTP